MGSTAMLPAESMVYTSYMKWIHDQEEHERLENYHTYNEYYYGNQTVRLPEKIKLTLEQDLAVICNYCKPVVDIGVQFLCGDKIGIDATENGGITDSTVFAEQLLYNVYKANKLLYQNMLKLLRINGKKGDVFLKLYVRDGFIRVSVLRPDQVFPKYYDDDYEIMEHCTIKSFTFDAEGKRYWRAQVFYPDHVDYYDLGTRPGDEGSPKGSRWKVRFEANRWQHQWDDYQYLNDTHIFDSWTYVDTVENPLGVIPIIHIKNNIDDLPFGVSALQPITPLQDALNKAITDLYVAMDTQAFQRLFILGSMGNDDISVAPGTVVQLPEGESVQVVQPGNISSMIFGMQDTVQHIATVSRIPVEAFRGFTGIPVSGYALRILFMGLEALCNETIANVGNALTDLNSLILRTSVLMGYVNKNEFAGVSTEVHFVNGIPIDKLSDTQYYGMMMNMRVMSRQTVMEKSRIENVEQEKAQIYQEFLEDYGLQAMVEESQVEEEQVEEQEEENG